MPVADSSNQPSWADRVEQGEDVPLPSLPPAQVRDREGDVADGEEKVTTEYREDEEGRKVKVLRHYKIERRQVSKSVARRKGFAFINFVHREDAARAIANVNGFGYDNLILSVEWAKPSGTA